MLDKKSIHLIGVLFAIMLGIALLLLCSQSAYAKDKTVKGVYFYVSLCGNCKEIEKAIETVNNKLLAEMPDVSLNIDRFNINENKNLELLYKYYEHYNIPNKKQSVPILFISDKFYQDKTEILNEVPKLLRSNDLKDTPMLSSEKVKKNLSAIDMASIMLVGFLNGLNPCSLSMLLFFLSMIMSRKGRILMMGFSFTAGKFIAYLLLGTLLYGTLSEINTGYYKAVLKALFIIFSLFLVYLNLKDFFSAKREDYKNIKNQLPTKIRKYNHRIMNRIMNNGTGVVLVILCFVLGLVISVGEFLCTGQIYVATMVYMLKSGTSLSIKALVCLVLYDLAFIMPPLLITILIAKGTGIFDVSEIVRGKLHIIKLLNALIILVFCIVAIIFL